MILWHRRAATDSTTASDKDEDNAAYFSAEEEKAEEDALGSALKLVMALARLVRLRKKSLTQELFLFGEEKEVVLALMR